jgi:tyrosyl-tRNA synthetase
MPSFAPASDQLSLLELGIVDIHVRNELEQRLEESRREGRPLRVKAGFDPTRPDLHLGHCVLLQKLRGFQDLGHTAIFLVGDFTAMIGDPTGRDETRPRLSREEVDRSAATYLTQAFKVLDPGRVELRRNSEWLDRLPLTETVELMAKATVSRMLERKDFRARFDAGRAIHQDEFLYPLLQGYDSVALECDVELGGTDQLFNLLVGRDLMGKYGKRPQIIMTTPILEGTDARLEDGEVRGRKMSKSADNYIGLQEDPVTMYRKTMQIDDAVIFRFFDLLSQRRREDIAALKEKMAGGGDPREIKAIFGREIVERFHGPAAAVQASREFEAIYSRDAIPNDLPWTEVKPTGDVAELAWTLRQANLVASTSEGRRMVEQGGVEVDGRRVTDPRAQLKVGSEYVIRVGSKNRRFARVRVIS